MTRIGENVSCRSDTSMRRYQDGGRQSLMLQIVSSCFRQADVQPSEPLIRYILAK